MPNMSSFIKTIKKMDLTIRADFGDKIHISEYLIVYSNELNSYSKESFFPFIFLPFLSMVLSFFHKPKYKIGDIVSVQVNRPLLPRAIIKYLNNSFIVTNDPRGLGSYKLYELRPFGCESEWTPVRISENFLARD